MIKIRLPIVAVLFVAVAGAGESLHPVRWDGIAFDTPVAFSAPAEIGLDAVALVSPAEAAPEEAAMELRLVRIPADMLEAFGGDAGLVMDYVKADFFGTTLPGVHATERVFLGRTVAGSSQDTTIPRKGVMETYLVPLSGGAHVAIALWRCDDTSADASEATMSALAASLREDSED